MVLIALVLSDVFVRNDEIKFSIEINICDEGASLWE